MASSFSISVLSNIGAQFSYNPPLINALNKQKLSFVARDQRHRLGNKNSRLVAVVKAEGEINHGIRKNEPKVVDSVLVSELSKSLTAYCRQPGILCKLPTLGSVGLDAARVEAHLVGNLKVGLSCFTHAYQVGNPEVEWLHPRLSALALAPFVWDTQ